MSLIPADECLARCDELQRLLQEAEERWCRIEAAVEEVEDNVFRGQEFDALRQRFCLEESVATDWSHGGLRSKVRQRIYRLLFLPLCQRLSAHMRLELPAEGIDRSDPAWALEAVLNHWAHTTEPGVQKAREEDAKLTKTIKKTERDERKQGVMALGIGQDTKKVAALKRQRPGIWDPVREDVEGLLALAKKLGDFLSMEGSPQAIQHMAGAVPAVVARATCDWIYEACLVDTQSIEEWWNAALCTLQRHPVLWQCLAEQEGLFLRKVESNLAALRASGRAEYAALATFGASEVTAFRPPPPPGAGSAPGRGNGAAPRRSTSAVPVARVPVTTHGWPEEEVRLLALTIADAMDRLRMIRDSAGWQIVHAARRLYKDLAALEQPWHQVSRRDGVAAVLACLDLPLPFEEEPPLPSSLPAAPPPLPPPGIIGDGYSPATSSTSPCCPDLHQVGPDIPDAALLVMQRLDKLKATVSELREDFWSQLPPRKFSTAPVVVQLLEDTVRHLAGLSDDLIEVLDEPEPGKASEWLRQWLEFPKDSEAPQAVEAALSALTLLPDAKLPAEDRRVRRKSLALTRGIQALLEGDARLSAPLAAPLADAALLSDMLPAHMEAGADRCEEVPGMGEASLAVSLPPKVVTSTVPTSPRTAYVPRHSNRVLAAAEQKSPRPPSREAAPEGRPAPETAGASGGYAPVAPPPPGGFEVTRPATAPDGAAFRRKLPNARPRTAPKPAKGPGISEAVHGSEEDSAHPPPSSASSPKARGGGADTPSTTCDDTEVACRPKTGLNGSYVSLAWAA
eukprot:TRINITY_DN7048_c0_g1_i1.p1 TRINITY_DN7048_c0_g1~~TRINITY_DN7048_c0_g1_i1.p1  ORF type:complete len:795 (-),score=180.52 TRINITY_DN7048_c0_g1_i1:88-2472(-)